MIDPQDFILTTDLDSIGSRSRVAGTITFPGSTLIPAAGIVRRSTVVTVPSNALSNIRFETSKDSGKDYLASAQRSFERTGSFGTYSIFVAGYHTSATELTLEVYVSNPYGVNFTSEAGDETFTFKIRPIIDPFS